MTRLAKAWCIAALVAIGSANPQRTAAQPAQPAPPSPLPALSGPYAVGRTSFDWTDASRTDAESPGGHRELVVWVWYPASPKTGAERAEWMPGKWGELFLADYLAAHPELGGGGTTQSLAAIRTHAYADAPAAPSPLRFPVLLFAPGTGATPLEYAGVIEDVVSHGYIVAGIVPTYFARATVFSDGRTVIGREVLEATGNRGARPSAALAIHAYEQAASIWSRDMTFALNQLALVDADARSPLRGRFDLGRVGAVGHSLGGAAVAQVALDDRRVRAAFSIDGSPIWNSANPPLGKPLLILSAASTMAAYGPLLPGAAPGRHLRVAGTAHTFSSDLRLMPFTSPGGGPPTTPAGFTAPARALTITATYVELFFGMYLKGQATGLLGGPSAEFPEVTFEGADGRR